MATVTMKDYERALQRARTDQCVIRGQDTDRNGNQTFLVGHVGDDTGYYTVRMARGANQMTCNCEAGRRNLYCKHRSLVRFWLLEQRKAYNEVVVKAKAPVEQPSLWTSDRETAPRVVKPFSIWAAE